MPCGATSAAKCEPCAEANRRLRMQQIREGWHLTEEPVTTPDAPTDEQRIWWSTGLSWSSPARRCDGGRVGPGARAGRGD
ncbi:replication initiator [Actinocatenispora sera]|uniref:replication initiator n=1 Tax=Actinocatenispora sera TaxID=390989 RepID=UPI003CC7F078